ncbi:MAG: hypothetical protein FD123_36 [Bacteroidetes bacterium]|nr:MAG: hypothetical protein FD123_36 [Bacteroidota bacterium]
MKKDIPMPAVENVSVAIVREKPEGEEWNVYLVNLRGEELKNVLITSTGYGDIDGTPKKTSTLRHFFAAVPPNSYEKVEPIMEYTFGLSNEYWVSFSIGEQMYDKRYVFLPETIQESNFTQVPIIGKKGVMIK